MGKEIETNKQTSKPTCYKMFSSYWLFKNGIALGKILNFLPIFSLHSENEIIFFVVQDEVILLVFHTAKIGWSHN